MLFRAAAIGDARGEILQTFLEFAAENRLHTEPAQPGFVHRRIETVKADVRGGIRATDNREKFDGEARGGVHGNVKGDERRAADHFLAERLAREIEASDFIAARTKPCGGRSQTERLAAKLIS